MNRSGPSHRCLKICAVSLLLPEGLTTPEDNSRRAASLIASLVLERPDVVCFPELFPVMNVPRELVISRASEIQKNVLAWAQDQCRFLRSWIILPTVETEGARIYNTAFLLDRQGAIAGKYRKTHLAPEESKIFGVNTAGNCYPVFEIDFGKIAIMTCMDVHYPEVARIYALKGAEVLFWPTMAYGPSEEFLEICLRSRAIDNQMYCVAANYVNIPYLPGKFMGRASIVGLDGRFRADTGNRPGIASAIVDLDEPYEMWYEGPLKTRLPSLRRTLLDTRRPETYHVLCESLEHGSETQ